MKLIYFISAVFLVFSLSACETGRFLSREGSKSGVYKNSGVIKKKSPYSVADTMDRFERVLTQKGLTVFTRVNHGEGAKKVGLKMPESELIIFGNPKVGSLLMIENPEVGLVLPMKVLVFADETGQTYISYSDPKVMQARFSIQENAELIEKVASVLDNITGGAIAP